MIGYQFNWALYGVLVTQVYWYYLSNFADGWRVKAIVYGTLFIETVQIAFATHDSAFQFALTWGQTSHLDDLDFIWITMPVTIALVSMITQLFYAWRLRILGVRRGHVVPAVIAILSVFQGISALYTAIRSVIMDSHSRSSLASNLLVSDVLWLSSTALCDILIFTFMTCHLSQMRTTNTKTDKIINDIIRLVIETGMVTAAAAIVDLVLFVTNNPWFAVLSLVLSKLYSDSLLVVLNNRPSCQRSQHYDSTESYRMRGVDHLERRCDKTRGEPGRRNPEDTEVRCLPVESSGSA